MRSRLLVPAVLASLASLLLAAAASASFHLIKVREVFPSAGNDAYVVLQMYAPGQDLVGGHSLTSYNNKGVLVDTATFAGKVGNGDNQRTLLVADDGFQAAFGIAPDLVDSGLNLAPAGGAVCWNAGGSPADCVAWGNFSGPAVDPVGTPAAPGGVPAGTALRRTIARACPTLLEEADDTDNSAADLLAVTPGPLPNSAVPAELACGGGGGGPSGGSGGGHAGPQTILKGKPAPRSRDRTPTFRFRSDHADATFQCALDKKRFRACRSPFTTKRLTVGRHTFRVRAREGSGEVDASPATFSFRVLPAR
jgi:hypothetical protein